MKHQGTVTLETARLTLRKFNTNDIAPSFRNWTGDNKVTEFLRWPTHANIRITENVLTDWISKYINSDFYQWAIITFFFEQVGAKRIESQHDPENVGSGKVMEKCGLIFEGTLRNADWNNRGIVDAKMYAILASDYYKNK